MKARTDTPNHEHDCIHCKFLGNDHYGNDWYFCEDFVFPSLMSTVIMRRSSEGHDYHSLPVSALYVEGKWDPVELKTPRVPPTDPLSWIFTAYHVWRKHVVEQKKTGDSPETGVDVGLTADEAEQYYGGEEK
jgi:hypothetical protein